MDGQNLRTASDYINNLLLARGLLRNGKSIDFVQPASTHVGNSDSTMARIINLVHDLVLRRDREAEHRENLATTVRTLRRTEARQTLEIDQLQNKISDLSRSLALAEGQERAFKVTIRDAEATTRGLKEQVQRMKATIQQVRAQCATDIRKRDIEMQRLKSHLTDRQRGKREGLGVTTITITPTPKSDLVRKATEGGHNLDGPGYSLRQETTEFLTHLCQNLSDENDALISMAKNSIQTLKTLQGLPDSVAKEGQPQSERGYSERLSADSENLVHPTQYETLASEMDKVLDHLRSLLTNPSFVPLEELEVRDNEIFRLRKGWEKMETRWKEAVAMMDGWHKRMAEGGGPVNIEELKLGMGLGLGIYDHKPALDKLRKTVPVLVTPDGEKMELTEDEVDVDDRDEELKNTGFADGGPAQIATDRSGRLDHALGERSGNAQVYRSPRRVPRTADSERSSSDIDDDDAFLVERDIIKHHRKQTKRGAESKIPRQVGAFPWTKPDRSTKEPTNNERIPKAKPGMTVTEKLALVESEARSAEEERKANGNKKRSNATRKSKQGNRRRKSTLSPEELEELLRMAPDR